MKKNTKKMLTKLEAIGVTTGAVILTAAGHWIIGPAALVGWGAWRTKKWMNKKRDEVAKQRGYKDYQDFLDNN